jgi:hypothetical protein
MAWATWWLTFGITVAVLVVTSIGSAEAPASWGGRSIGEYAFVAVILAFPLVGLVVLVRRPHNRVGWLLLGVGLAWAIPGLLDIYAHYGLVIAPGTVPDADVAAAVSEGTWAWGVLAMIFLILMFPDGRLPSRRWRPVAWVTAAAAILVPTAITLAPGDLEEAPVAGLVNPLARDSLAPVADALLVVGLPLVPVCVVAAALSVVLRFRSSTGIEREQIKWLAAAGGCFAALFATALTTTLVAEVATGGSPGSLPPLVGFLQEASLVSFLLLPLAVGVAILRHRLFDIDVVINRALVYGTLTAALAGLYLGSVLLLQLVLRPVQVDSDLAVALSTLAVAAVFRPARNRIQLSVDRRFYRSRYDAARTLEAFSGRLRHQVDLDAVGAELLAACRETVQPAHASVWLAASRRLT